MWGQLKQDGKPAPVEKFKSANYARLSDDKKTSSIAVEQDGSALKLDFSQVLAKMEFDSYALTFETSNSIFITKTFSVAAQISEKLEVEVVKSTKQELELKVKSSFKSGSERPQNVYAILQKDNQLPFQIQGYFKDGSYIISSVFKKLISEGVNGRYKLTVFSEDPRAFNSVKHELKEVEVDVSEGSMDRVRDGMRDDHKLLDEITNYFPPEEPQKSPIVPFAVTAVLGFLFLNYFSNLYAVGANFSNISFSGFLFTLNYMAIIGVIVAFWFKINLINTLWILVAITPFTLYNMNAGLTAENCHVG